MTLFNEIVTEVSLLPQEAARFTGHCHDEALTLAISELNGKGTTAKILGSYPASTWME